MTTITVALSDDQLARLRRVAQEFQVAPEELLRASLQDLLGRPDDEFERAVSHVVRKNAELYKRLSR